jgi:glutamate-1-semialdehyde aminotransferase
MAAYPLAALDEGVYLAPHCFMNTTTAMDERVIDDVLEACSRATARGGASSASRGQAASCRRVL